MKSENPILLLEDDEVDIMSVKRALKQLKIINPLKIAKNGEEGLKYLQDSNNKRPCLILLDINMPKMNGIEFLKIIKNDEVLKRTPVVVLTASNEEQDKVETFNQGISGYMVKPSDFKSLVTIIKSIDGYWTYSETI